MLPENLYQSLPYIYLIVGLALFYILPTPYNFFSGGILVVAAVIIIKMRRENAAKKNAKIVRRKSSL
jgi:hypothetical protein